MKKMIPIAAEKNINWAVVKKIRNTIKICQRFCFPTQIFEQTRSETDANDLHMREDFHNQKQ
jgi:hypothetical protein